MKLAFAAIIAAYGVILIGAAIMVSPRCDSRISSIRVGHMLIGGCE